MGSCRADARERGCDGSPTPSGVQNLTVTGGTLTFPIPTAPKYYHLIRALNLRPNWGSEKLKMAVDST
jgi:hypothetical protein